MGGSLDFREIIAMKNYKIVEELVKAKDKLAERDALLKFMDSVLKYISEEVKGFEHYAVYKTADTLDYIAISGIADAMYKHDDPATAMMKSLYDIIAAMFGRLLDYYRMYLNENRESLKEIYSEDVDKYVTVIAKYAKKYPAEVVEGLILFINTVFDKVRDVKKQVEKYGFVLW
jgi:hypothetical protein